MNKYHGNWSSLDEMITDFEGSSWFSEQENKDKIVYDFPLEEELIYAAYHQESYDGYASVIFSKEGKLFEVNASHCSCNGLEGQWKPEETSWEAIVMRKNSWCSPDELIEYAKEQMSAHAS